VLLGEAGADGAVAVHEAVPIDDLDREVVGAGVPDAVGAHAGALDAEREDVAPVHGVEDGRGVRVARVVRQHLLQLRDGRPEADAVLGPALPGVRVLVVGRVDEPVYGGLVQALCGGIRLVQDRPGGPGPRVLLSAQKGTSCMR
jgi:hypothetical protein